MNKLHRLSLSAWPSATIISILLFFALHERCLGQTNTKPLATGDWSDIVEDNDEHSTYSLRGRLLVYDDKSPDAANHARVYLELQNVFKVAWSLPLEVYFNVGDWPKSSLSFALLDAHGKPIPQEDIAIRGRMPDPHHVVLPCDSTIRLRIDLYTLGRTTKADGLEIFVNNGYWLVRPDATNVVFLSASLTTSDPPKSFGDHVWQGSLHLPAVKIPITGHE